MSAIRRNGSVGNIGVEERLWGRCRQVNDDTNDAGDAATMQTTAATITHATAAEMRQATAVAAEMRQAAAAAATTTQTVARTRPAPDATEMLQAIWQRQRARVGERLELIERAMQALAQGRLDTSLQAEAERAAHMLAGSLGTFGFMHASRAAHELEVELAAPQPARAASIASLLREVREELGGQKPRQAREELGGQRFREAREEVSS